MQFQLKKNELEAPLKLTKKAGAYRNSISESKETKERLYKKLIKKRGKPKTVHGILLLAVSRIYDDIYDNGGGNIVNNIHGNDPQKGDNGWQKAEYEIDVFYQGSFDALEKWLPSEHQPCLAEVKRLVLSDKVKISIAFDRLTDRVLHTILTTEDMPAPVV